MTEQVLVQFRADKSLREDCAKIYGSLGIDLSSAFRVFMEQTRAARGFPFPFATPKPKITREKALAAFQELREQARDVPEMTLDEINAEISEARAERRARRCHAMP